MQQGLNLWLQGERPAPKPLNQEDLLMYWRHHSSIWMNLLRLSFDWIFITPDVPSRRLFGATKLSLFLQQWPQKGAFSLTGYKTWSANP
jgi:hypothetical protein